MSDSNKKQVKINILTGFFGSGKTTLISNIIKAETLQNKIAIVQNEFSEEMGIETEVLTDSQGQSLGNLYEMANGCMCCAVKDNIIVFIENLILKKSDIEIVIIESHGISDISLLLKKFWLDQELESPLYLNSIICLVDCLNFDKNKLEMYEIFANQIISADKVLLNKIDKINFDKSEIHRIRDFIYSINPLAQITETEYSKVSTEYFLEESALNTKIDFQEVKNKQIHLEDEIIQISNISNSNIVTEDHEHFHQKHQIENMIIYTNLKSKSELDLAIGKIIWDLAEDNNFSIIRFKGIFYSQEGTFSIQGLYDLYEINNIQSSSKIDEIDEKQSKILFIGKGIRDNKDIIQSKLLV